jgi:hypothetical protein
MSLSSRRCWPSLLLLAIAYLSAPTVRAADIDPAKWLPTSAVFYLAVERPEPVLAALTDQAYVEMLSSLEPVAKMLRSGELKRLNQLVSVLEDRLGTDWRTALPQLLGGGVWLAFDART